MEESSVNSILPIVNNPLVTAIIGAIAGSVTTFLLSALSNHHFFRIRRYPLSYMIGKEWEAEWYHGDDVLYVKDVIHFGKSVWFGSIKAYGEMTSFDDNGTSRVYRYPITFKLSSTKVLTFSYYAQRFPHEQLMGVGCGSFNINGTEISGGWTGVVNPEKYGKNVIHGRLFMKSKS
jgi:hypothetical protein